MTKTVLTVLTGLALAASAQAGEDYSAKAPAPVPTAAPCLWTWFAGGSVGYVDDIDNEMYTLHVGAEYKCPGSESSHAIFLEVGYVDWNDSEHYGLYDGDYQYGTAKYSYDYNVVPITINYKYERPLFGAFNWYIGGGLGVAVSSIDIDTPFGDVDDDETTFFAQAATGLVWNISDSFEIFGGVRYLYMDGSDEIDGIDTRGILDDDFMYELGARFNF